MTYIVTITGSLSVEASKERVKEEVKAALRGMAENYPGSKRLLSVSVAEMPGQESAAVSEEY